MNHLFLLISFALLIPPYEVFAQRSVVLPSGVPNGALGGHAGAGLAPPAGLGRSPLGPSLDFDLSPARIASIFAQAKAEYSAALDRVAAAPYAKGDHPRSEDGGPMAAAPAAERNFANTVAALEGAQARFMESVNTASFLFSVSPDKAVRDAARRLDEESDSFLIETSQREDVYRAVRDAADKGEPLSGEDRRLLDATLRSYAREGMGLPAARRARGREVQKRLSELSIAFSENLKDDQDALEVDPGRLAGLPADFVSGLPRTAEGKVRVGLDYPTYRQVMKHSPDAGLRRELESKFNNQAADKNVPLLEEALALRHEQAVLLGYRSYADYAIEERMARSPDKVWDFLRRLKSLLYGRAKAELAELLDLKRNDEPGAAEVHNWDVSYYADKLLKLRYDYDPEKVQEYFPVQTVVEGTLSVYQESLGLRFREARGKTWHPDVRVYEISDKEDGRRIGWFYLDLYPREGKYKHAAAFTLVSGRELETGYREPVSAVVANFTRPSDGKPSLLTHGEVETFFHEFGHVMHQTLTKARYASFSGSRVARDFVEAPSQMLENFVWRPEVLERLSGHWRDPSRKLPKDLLEKMLKARNFLSAMDTLGQVALAALDLAYHTAVPADTTELMRRVFEEFDVRGPSPGTHFQARFGHLMGGYSAGYYGYLWSKVFAQDIFSRFETEGVLNPKTGADYRRAILEKGSTIDEADQLKAFLGREPNEEAFLRHLGIPPSAPAPLAAPAPFAKGDQPRSGDGGLLAAAESLANPYAFYRWLSGLPEYLDAGELAKAKVLLAAAGLLRKGPVMALREAGALTLLSVSDPAEPPVIIAPAGKDGGPQAGAYSPAERAFARRLEKALARDKAEGAFFNIAGLLSKLGSGTVEEDETDEAGRPKPPPSVSRASELPVDPVRQPKEYLARKLRDAMRSTDPRGALDMLRATRAEARERLNYQEGSRFLETLRSQAELLAKQFIPGLLEEAQGAAAEGKEALMKARLDAALEFVEYAPGWKDKVVEAYRRAQDTLDLIARYGLPDEKTGLPAAPAVSAPAAAEGNRAP